MGKMLLRHSSILHHTSILLIFSGFSFRAQVPNRADRDRLSVEAADEVRISSFFFPLLRVPRHHQIEKKQKQVKQRLHYLKIGVTLLARTPFTVPQAQSRKSNENLDIGIESSTEFCNCEMVLSLISHAK